MRTWFRETHARLQKHNEWRDIITAPEVDRSTPFYGLSKIVTPAESSVMLSEHTKDNDYKIDFNFLSLDISKGIGPQRETERYVVVEDNDKYRWYIREGSEYKWKQLPQNKVPLYAIFSIAESIT